MNQNEHRTLIKVKNIFFSLYFLSLLIMTISPSFYLSISGSQHIIWGIPLPFFYWIAIALLLMLGLSVMYLLECKLGEIPKEGEDA